MSTESGASLQMSERQGDSTEFAFATIRARILTGQILPGALLSQADLARTLGISRTPLREALNRLTSEGLVIGGNYNRRMRVSELDLDDFDQIYAARIALEPVAITATVARLDDERRADLKREVEEMDVAIEARDMDAFRAHHRAFHLGLTSLAGARLDRILTDLWDHSERYRLAYLHYDYVGRGSALVDRLEFSQQEHREMLTAALARDGDACASVLVTHLTRTLDAVFLEARDIPRPRVAPKAIHSHLLKSHER